MSRQEKIREARRLRALGWTAPEIGRELGVSDSTIRNWYLGSDCIDCGAPIEGSNGVKGQRCSPCRHAWESEQKVWTREAIIEAIQRWAREHGRPPMALDWVRAGEHHPPASNVYRTRTKPRLEFATWNDAIRAAGFTPRDRGRYLRDLDHGIGHRQRQVVELLATATRPIAPGHVSRTLNCHRNSAWQALDLLVRRGLAERVGRGQYVAARSERAAAA